MKRIQLWNRYHIADYALAHIAEYSHNMADAKAGILALPRPKYRNLLRELESDVDLTQFSISRTDDASLTRMAALSTMWHTVGTADVQGFELKVKKTQEVVEAACLMIPLAERYLAEGGLIAREPFSSDPPVEVQVLSEAEMSSRLLSHRAEYDIEFGRAFGRRTAGGNAPGKAAGQRDIYDLVNASGSAAREAAIAVLTKDDDDLHLTSADSEEALRAAIKALNEQAGVR